VNGAARRWNVVVRMEVEKRRKRLEARRRVLVPLQRLEDEVKVDSRDVTCFR